MVLNVELLRRVQRHIRREPESFDMLFWIFERGCGTVACIGGWAVLLSGGTHSSGIERDARDARRALGLNLGAGDRLLFLTDWPDPFQREYRGARTPSERAEVACRYIDHFVAQYAPNAEPDAPA